MEKATYWGVCPCRRQVSLPCPEPMCWALSSPFSVQRARALWGAASPRIRHWLVSVLFGVNGSHGNLWRV